MSGSNTASGSVMHEDDLLLFRPGSIRALLTADPITTLRSDRLLGAVEEASLRVTAIPLNRFSAMADIREQVLHVLARAALAIWPDWYETTSFVCGNRPSSMAPRTGMDTVLDNAMRTKAQTGIVDAWLKTSVTLCTEGRLPLPPGFPSPVQVQQLCLAIDPQRLLIMLVLPGPIPDDDALTSLAREAKWLCRQTRSRIAALLPEAIQGRKALDAVLTDVVRLPSESASLHRPASHDLTSEIIWPVFGRPHPLSLPEQMLATHLGRDMELDELFQFNQRVFTRWGDMFVADLLWPQGRVVVELDGCRVPGKSEAFRPDRDRDYRLLISGYTVVRVNSFEILEDPARVVDRIRDVVRFCCAETGRTAS